MDQFAEIVGTEAEVSSGKDVMQDALVAIRNHLGMEIAYISEFVDGRSVFRRVDAPGLEHLIKPGDSQSLDDVYCTHILEGRLPELIPDTSLEPFAAAMPITRAVPIGSHVSLPIRLADGTPYGMFCCLSPRPMPTLNARDLDTMKIFAGLAAKQVNAELNQQLAAREIRDTIEAVIAGSEFRVVFQPIFDLARMEIVAYEALCRFAPEPYRSPDLWFADAAKVGLGIDLELAVIEAALARFQGAPAGVRLSVNASPETVLCGRLRDVLAAGAPERTILELTEHARVADYDALSGALAPIRALGVEIAVDDAGAGYSSLQHIIQLRADLIKMDMSITRQVDTDPARRALASAILFYARETGASVVAEGVETEGELQVLRTLGINKGQGYLLGRPGAVDWAADRLVGRSGLAG
jgi:EAL domain-containing protein (putative c-di-GMP-specific phosphodiesterase class I)